ncbi:MAG TPA: hypothetical protein V6C96_02790 [Vampirovibrionales bacterium]
MQQGILQSNWEYALTTSNPKQVFIDSIQEITKDADEALRILWAQQIINKKFLEDRKPSTIALSLSSSIQLIAQQAQDLDPQAVIVELLNYYFPTEQDMENFQLALEGKMDVLLRETINSAKQSLPEKMLAINPDEDFEKNKANMPIFSDAEEKLEEQLAKAQQPNEALFGRASVKHDAANTPEEVLLLGRSKLKEFMEQRSLAEKRGVKVQNLFPKKVQEIVEEYFSEMGLN